MANGGGAFRCEKRSSILHFPHELIVMVSVSPEEAALAGVVLNHGQHRMPHGFVEIAEHCIAVNFENLAQLLHYDVAEKKTVRVGSFCNFWVS